jgi:excinuclease ABC subunit A
VIEHNLDVIKSADWLIDLGPEGGAGGGEILATGTPEHLSTVKKSHTGVFLKEVLESDGRAQHARAPKIRQSKSRAAKDPSAAMRATG